MGIVVVSTGYDPPTKSRCIESVARQTVPHRHLWVDAADQVHPKAAARNLVDLVTYSGSEDTDIVVWLDLDDWLAHDRVLEKVQEFYSSPDVWCTYGSYEHEDGAPGICQPYRTDQYRQEPWFASHLKTFRAGLFKKIRTEDLQDERGEWLSLCIDQAVMLPILEMSGPEHVGFCKEVLCVYNYKNSFAHRATPEKLAEEMRALATVRMRSPYERLEAL